MIPLPATANTTVAVLGLGRSGLQAAKALQASGAEVWAWDDQTEARARAEAEGVPLTDLYRADWSVPDSLVLSPGIPHRLPQPHPLAARAREAGCEIVCDVELLGRAQPQARFVGVTGTNGKSTTTALIGHVLAYAGQPAQVGGNLGPPVLDFEPAGPDGLYVLELSSYQLERTDSIAFEVAVWLNISPDHLDRHGDLDGYVGAKQRIFTHQTGRQSAVVGVDDARSRRVHDVLADGGGPAAVAVSGQQPVAGGVGVAADGTLVDDLDGAAAQVCDLTRMTSLPGRHNWQNAAAAYAACRRLGLDAGTIAAALHSFPGLPHRQEPVATVDGVAFVNDSKATNADAAARALACYATVYWIAGGRAKAGGLAGTEAQFDRIRCAYLIGEAADAFARELAGRLETVVATDLETAVRTAFADAKAAGAGAEAPVVLLSPACASFDQYADFAERGDAFKAVVAELEGARGAMQNAHLSGPQAGGAA
jgi:UDP-N-acetylmuramoylalanine--D-glutamate ligase